MNDARADAGAGPLAEDGAIGWVPRDWADHMAATGSLAHNPDYAGQVASSRPEATTFAENVGYASDGARAVFDAFMRSAGHRANIVSRAFTHVATGCRRDASGVLWVAVDFWG